METLKPFVEYDTDGEIESVEDVERFLECLRNLKVGWEIIEERAARLSQNKKRIYRELEFAMAPKVTAFITENYGIGRKLPTLEGEILVQQTGVLWIGFPVHRNHGSEHPRGLSGRRFSRSRNREDGRRADSAGSGKESGRGSDAEKV